MAPLSLCPIVLATLLGVGSAREDRPDPKPGEPYPVRVLPSLADGTPLSVTHFRGRRVLLLHFASW